MRKKKKLTDAQKIDGWTRDPRRVKIDVEELYARGWEAGQVGSIEWEGYCWERFFLTTDNYGMVDEDGPYCVVFWTPDGDYLGVLGRWNADTGECL